MTMTTITTITIQASISLSSKGLEMGKKIKGGKKEKKKIGGKYNF